MGMSTTPTGDRKRETDKKEQESRERERKQAHEISEARREQAERQRVARPEGGVGFGFDQDMPASGEMDRLYGSLTRKYGDALNDPKLVLTVMALTSRAGDADYNLDLSKRRAENVAKILREQYGVRAKIEIEATGEEWAEFWGLPEKRDNHRCRIAWVFTRPTADKADAAKERPETGEPGGGERTTIPSKYTGDYKYSREWAELMLAWAVNRPEVKRPLGTVAEVAARREDANRFRQEIAEASSVHDRLWGVRPKAGFIFDFFHASEVKRLGEWLEEGGYAGFPMLDEYVIHWLRKGAT